MQSGQERLLISALVALLMIGPSKMIYGQLDAIQFVDITVPAGISFKHVSSPEKKYIVESMSGGVALFDYDNDGYLDIFLVNSLTVELLKANKRTRSALYHNNGDGTFTDVTDKAGVTDIGWGMGVAVGDYNNDGFDDLYVTCLGPNHLLRNNGNGTFTDVTSKAGVGDARWSTGAAFLDYDNDGKLDLFVTNYVGFDINHLPAFGEGPTCQFKGIPVQCGPRGLPGAGDTLYHNNGDGTFSDVSKKAGVADSIGYYGLDVVASDFDGDGRIDVFVANDSTPNYLYHNNGNGTFSEIGFESGLAVNGNGAEQGCMGVTVGDYDHDGRLDVFVANGHAYPQRDHYRQRKLLHRNNRDGTFSEVGMQCGSALQEERASRGTAFGDIDNDGDIDVIVNDLDASPQLLRNDGGNRNNSVLVKTIGVKSNRDGIGARVKVVSDAVPITLHAERFHEYRVI